jgi:23S rRNA (cytidine1920-2'-O)/16S rRNA (cytidine1409-2'-O)-methyltransferase
VKKRLDVLLVERGLAESRAQAQALVLAGLVPGHSKAGEQLSDDVDLQVERPPLYVSRGGDKLAHGLAELGVDPAGRDALDVGASTGGFTDCLLQNGARRVYAVDVGYGLLDYSLRMDERVTVIERTNARDLAPLPEACDLAVFDLSFIGVEKVIPAACRSLKADGALIVLLKPQFQARREEVGKKGVVKDRLVHAAVIGRFVAWSADNGLRLLGLTQSPVVGPAGNREFLLHLRMQRPFLR